MDLKLHVIILTHKVLISKFISAYKIELIKLKQQKPDNYGQKSKINLYECEIWFVLYLTNIDILEYIFYIRYILTRISMLVKIRGSKNEVT